MKPDEIKTLSFKIIDKEAGIRKEELKHFGAAVNGN